MFLKRFGLRRLVRSCRPLLVPAAAVVLVVTASGAGCSAGGDEAKFGAAGSGGGKVVGKGGASNGGSGGTQLFQDVMTVPETGSNAGKVPETCAEAQQTKSYIGCEYWPTVTPNSSLFKKFEFAIVVSNPTKKDAQVTVERKGSQIKQVTVPPSGLSTITLPWVDELKQDTSETVPEVKSALVSGGAFHVTSTIPIIVYQFNPLEFQLASKPLDCPYVVELGGCFSFTNDASMLLPTTALRGEYYAMSYPTHHFGAGGQWANTPGFVAVVGTAQGTKVKVTPSSYVREGDGVQTLSPGQQGEYTLNAGDVLVLASGRLPNGSSEQPGKPCSNEQDIDFCPSPAEYDLTGTKIVADKPVAVLGGHDCTFVPYNRFACDHIEESMFPVETLGQDLVVTAPHAVAAIGKNPGAPDNQYVRVLSAADNNKITFDPNVHDPVTLKAGEWIEIGPLTEDFRIQSDNRILVAQYMVGENFNGNSAGAGDPSESVAIPIEQYRLKYTFLAPTSYTHNFVNVVAPTGTAVEIDGTSIPSGEFKSIGASGLSVARHKIEGGSHSMSSTKNFGIVVYGYGSYTSYMYPGGLNLETVTIVPK